MLTVACWRWGKKYPDAHVERLKAGVERNLSIPHRFVVITDQDAPKGCEKIAIERPDLLSIRDGCYARLQMFSPEWRKTNGIDSILCFDLDTVIVRSIDLIALRPEAFVILHGGHLNPCPFNGSIMLVRDGAPEAVWTEFDADEAERVAMADGIWRGSDQTWIAHKAPAAAGFGVADGVYAYGKPGWPAGTRLPPDARIVTFPGKRDPSNLLHIDWIRANWR